MYTIKTPVEGYTGLGYGLRFVNGEAHTDNERIAKILRKLGYTVTKNGVSEKKNPDDLREEAAALGIRVAWNAKPETIRRMIEEHRSGGGNDGYIETAENPPADNR